MSLRVIAGKARGHRLKTVPGDTTRPITDRVKEALFNIISGDVVDSNWWDLFAGTGAVGIEALSRGASFVRFTDSSRAPIDTIRFNVAHCGFQSQSEIRRADAFALLASPPDRRFEYIYVAPPQYQEMWARSLEILDDNLGWLADDGWVIVQIHPRESVPLSLQHLEEVDRRRYGSTLLVFYESK